MAPKVERSGLAGRRLMLALPLGIAGLLAPLLAGSGWTVAASVGWAATALSISGRIWWRIRGMDAAETARHARAEDYSRGTADLVVLSACVASLVAVGFTLVQARHEGGVTKGLLIMLAIVVVALSWITVQLVFTVRYGDLYYDHPVGGIDFNGGEPADYHDFAYLALTLGMTYQVSDTNISSKSVRRTATRHALLSYVFGAVIVALAINTVATLLL